MSLKSQGGQRDIGNITYQVMIVYIKYECYDHMLNTSQVCKMSSYKHYQTIQFNHLIWE